MGLPRPPEQQCFELGVAAERFIIPRIRAAFPGAVEAIRTLHAMGYALHTASGASSVMLEGYLEPLGVRDCFGRLYGPDLIEHFKDSPTFYERLLADLGLPAQNALVVDDNPKVLCWAAELGAHTMLVGRRADVEAFPQIGSLAELPSIIGGIGEP
jgi:HAD superfamily hydrolase (TIGR01509 family)